MSTVLRDLSELAAHYAPFAWFPAIWTLSLAAVCVAGARLRAIEPSSAPSERLHPSPALIAAGSALGVFVIAYVALVFYHDDLVGQDYSLITGGRFPTVLIWPHAGRFIPFAFQEYSLLSLIGTSAALYHTWSVVQLVILLACVFYLIDTTPAWFRCLVMMFLLTQASFVYSFFGLVFTERDLVFWLALWLACMQWFARSGRREAFWGAMLAAQVALYYKETAFVLIGAFAGTRLVWSAWRSADRLRQKQFAGFARDHTLEFGLVFLCVVFLLSYVIAIVPNVTQSYAGTGGRAGASLAALASYLRSDLLLGALAAALVWRMARIIRTGSAPDLFWDPLAAAALAFALAYVALGITREYYLAPVDLVAILYLGRLAWDGLRVNRRLTIATAVLVAGWTLQQNVAESAFYLATRKEYVNGRVRLETALRNHALMTRRQNVTLFFPQAGGFQLMEFAAFLRYKGWRPAHEPAREFSLAPAFILKSAHQYPGDVCYPSHEFRCEYSPAPRAGELIVLFPGRHVDARYLAALAFGADQVFHYRPAPTTIERALRALVPGARMVDAATDGYLFEVKSRAVGYYSPP